MFPEDRVKIMAPMNRIDIYGAFVCFLGWLFPCDKAVFKNNCRVFQVHRAKLSRAAVNRFWTRGALADLFRIFAFRTS